MKAINVSLSERWYLKNCKDKKMLFNNYSGVTYNVTDTLYNFLLQCDGTRTQEDLISTFGNQEEVIEELKMFYQKNILVNSSIKRSNFAAPIFKGELIKRLTIHITSNCNLDCKHCYVSDIEKCTFSTLKLGTILEEAFQMNVLNLSLTGGEPFLYPDTLEYIITKCLYYGMRIENIFTNGTLLEDNKVVVTQLKDAFEITFYVSVDGLHETYDIFRGKKNAFQNLCKGLNILEEIDAKLFINILLNKTNLNQLLDIYAFARKYRNFARIRISNGFNLGNWVTNKGELQISIKEEINAIKALIRLWVNDGKPCEMEYGYLFRHLFGKTYLIKDQNYTKDSLCCEYYKNVCVIFPDGSVTPCGLTYPHFICGSVHGNRLSDIWNSEKMKSFKDLKIKDLSLDECLGCQFLSKCGTGCRGKALLNGKGYLDLDITICDLYKKGIYDDFESFIIDEVISESV